jgi:hypothetical protein
MYRIKRRSGKHTEVNESGVIENIMAGNLLLDNHTS